MKRAWTVISFVAVVNLLTLMILVTWAWQTGRLDADRLAAIRAVLAGEELQVPAPAEQEVSVVPTSLDIPLASSERLAWFDQWEMEQEQRLQQLMSEAERRTREVQNRLNDLERERQAFEAERMAHHEAVHAEAAAEAERRFEQTVRLYERARPATAKIWLMGMIEQWGIERAGQLLAAMDQRSAARLLQAFETEEEQRLATNLLNMLGGPDGTVQNQEMHSDDIARNPSSADRGNP